MNPTLKMIPPAELAENPKNTRYHPGAQMHAIRESLERWGFLKPVLYNERTGRLINGHARVRLAVEEGVPEVPVFVVDLPYEQERELLLTYDRIAALRGTDAVGMLALLGEIAADGDLSLPPGFDEDYVAQLIEAAEAGEESFAAEETAPEANLTGQYRALTLRFPAAEHALFIAGVAELAERWGTEGVFATLATAMDRVEGVLGVLAGGAG